MSLMLRVWGVRVQVFRFFRPEGRSEDRAQEGIREIWV